MVSPSQADRGLSTPALLSCSWKAGAHASGRGKGDQRKAVSFQLPGRPTGLWKIILLLLKGTAGLFCSPTKRALCHVSAASGSNSVILTHDTSCLLQTIPFLMPHFNS